MKKNTKGFTLIELLAVIVILAIIALIATPIVLNLIEKARKGAAQDSAYGVRKAAQTYYYADLIENPNGWDAPQTINFPADAAKIDLDGTKPSAGSVTIAIDGTVSGTVTINGYSCPIANDGEIKCVKGGSAS